MSNVGFAVLLTLFIATNSENILLLTYTYGSFVGEVSVIGDALSERGHNVYIILPKPLEHKYSQYKTMANINVLTFENKEGGLFMDSDDFNKQMSYLNEAGDFNDIELLFFAAIRTHCVSLMEDSALMKKLNDIKFDLAIISDLNEEHCHVILPYNMKIPYITAFAMLPLWHIGVPALPSLVLTPYSTLTQCEDLSILERLQSIWEHYQFHNLPPVSEDLLEHYTDGKSSYIDIIKASEFFVIFRNEILECPAPRMPNTLFTAGLTYSEPASLPNEFTDKIGNNKVILVSFGTTGGVLKNHIVINLLQAFNNLKGYTILWKLVQDTSGLGMDIPSHVHFVKWLPQNDLLGHPNTRLFISHCGNNGVHESLYHGVPILGFPWIVDQWHNGFRLQARGYGTVFNLHTISAKDIEKQIKSLLNNDTIINNVKKVSDTMKQMQHPKYEISDMVEHIMKFGGAHLRSTAIDMPLYKLLMFDVLVFLALIILVLFLLCFIVCKCAISICKSQCCRGGGSKKKKE